MYCNKSQLLKVPVYWIAGEFVPRRIRTQNDWLWILRLIRTRVRIIQRIRTLYIAFFFYYMQYL